MAFDEEQFDSRLACPRCDQRLETLGEGYACRGCRVEFPNLGGVPWLFAEPDAARATWRERFHLLELTLERDAAEIAAALANDAPRATTRGRLTALERALGDHRAKLAALLAPLETSAAKASYETALALRTRLPPGQGIHSYYANLHRDWVWGQEENAAAWAALEHASARDGGFGATLVLGAGAARLAYDAHIANPKSLTVALDFNPLLMLAAQKIAGGETLELYEFPLAPRRTEDQAVLRTLCAETAADSARLRFVIADALRAPFAAQSFASVVTPWLVDVIDEDFATFAARVSTLLEAGGQWLNFGSLTFHDRAAERCYSLEECLEILDDTGFEVPRVDEREIPYMCSPASRHARRERVVTWAAVKQRACKRPPRWRALPDWIVKGDTPIPRSADFERQALSTRIYAYIMSLIDGRRSLRDIAKLLERERLMSADEAEAALRSFLTKMYDESQQPRSYS